MKIAKFLLSLVATGGLTWFLNTPQNIKGVPLPALGKIFSPFEGYWQNGISLTDKPADQTVNGLNKPVKVVYDDRLVPHIFAETDADAYFVQGFLHAQNRLWQMDFLTRAAGGRLAEAIGDRPLRPGFSTVDMDKLRRRQGVAEGAKKTVEEWQKDPATWALIQAYCAGANTYIDKLSYKDYPIEYKIFGIKPESWTPLHSSLIASFMALDLALGENDVQATNAKALLGADFDFVFPEYFPEQSPVVPSGTKFSVVSGGATSAVFDDKANPLSQNFQSIPFPDEYNDLQPDENNGSNNWVVAGSKTLNKRPILCGDPHLNMRLPAIWYELQISVPDMNVYGVSLPGIPSVVIGFNDHIAWTQTNVGHDVADWYKVQWTNPQRTEYKLDGVLKKVETRIETIQVKGMSPVVDTVKITALGPIVYENDTMPAANLAFNWLANNVTKSTLSVFQKLNKAKNYAAYAEAIKDFNVPAQNFAFACKDGDIALRIGGLLPKKAKGQGRFVQDGSSSTQLIKDYVPKDLNPGYRNPSRGYASSANQHSTDPSYPFYYNSEHFDAYRGRTVNQLLADMDSITVEDMKKMQNSNYNLFADDALKPMLKNLDTAALSAAEKPIYTELANWNRHFDADLIAPVYFEEWYNVFYEAMWDEITSRPDKARILKPTSWRTIAILRGDAQNKFFDKISTADKKETAKDILTESFKTMVLNMAKIQADISLRFPKNPKITWAQYKDTEVPHISNIPGMGRTHLLNGGHSRSINSVKKSHGPSWRMIVELGSDKPRAFVAYPGGQSGNPGSPYYDQFVETWAKGDYYEAVFLKKADETHPKLTVVQEFRNAQ
jgi:penicillin amidase